MKPKYLSVIVLAMILLISVSACSPQSNLSVEEYAIISISWEGESLLFEPIEGTREAILAKHADERSKSPTTYLPPVKVGSHDLNVMENYTDNLVTVVVYRNDRLEITVDAGVISPISNFRGIWLEDDHWFMEVAHVEEDLSDPNAGFDVWGEIIKDGESLNEKFGYDEAFNFQILSGRSFYFFSKDETLGYSYDGKDILLGYSDIPHYQCCSGSAFNPLPAENMVAFYASSGEQDYYVEIGFFE